MVKKMGLKYYHEFNKKIPREEVELHGKIVTEAVDKLFKDFSVVITGSYRRGRKECGDIDILIASPDWCPGGALQEIVKTLHAEGFITDYLEISDRDTPRDWNHHFDKFMGVSQLPGGLHRRIDIILVPRNSLPGTLIYFTGSDYFNRSLRLRAKDYGFYLCNHCLAKADTKGKRIGPPINLGSEKELLELLGLSYMEPGARDW